MLCSDFRAVRKNDPLLPDAGTWRNNHVYEGISDTPRASAFRSFGFELQGPCSAFTSWRARVSYTQAFALPAHNQRLVLRHVGFVLQQLFQISLNLAKNLFLAANGPRAAHAPTAASGTAHCAFHHAPSSASPRDDRTCRYPAFRRDQTLRQLLAASLAVASPSLCARSRYSS
jgi:hypothetical protein